jgi:hypothetical protein
VPFISSFQAVNSRFSNSQNGPLFGGQVSGDETTSFPIAIAFLIGANTEASLETGGSIAHSGLADSWNELSFAIKHHVALPGGFSMSVEPGIAIPLETGEAVAGLPLTIGYESARWSAAALLAGKIAMESSDTSIETGLLVGRSLAGGWFIGVEALHDLDAGTSRLGAGVQFAASDAAEFGLRYTHGMENDSPRSISLITILAF